MLSGYFMALQEDTKPSYQALIFKNKIWISVCNMLFYIYMCMYIKYIYGNH